MINFSQLTDKLNYPREVRGELSTLHASIITYVIDNFENRNSYKNKVIKLLNTISYYIIDGDTLPSDWSVDNPLENIQFLDSSVCEKKLKDLYIKQTTITWDIDNLDKIDRSPIQSTVIVESSANDTVSVPIGKPATPLFKTAKIKEDTPKDHLYIRPPTIPQFDVNRPWFQQVIDNSQYVIYTSLPEVPVIQNQISVTTDINRMTTSDLMKLYPNCSIKTRPAAMYNEVAGLTFDEDLGIIIPVVGFSPKQVKDNIIRYPHWFKLLRNVNGDIVNFYQHIEVDGELHDTLSYWDNLPESNQMPKSAEFIKEYVVRRYLLERDHKDILHKYPMFGTLGPFLILFTSTDSYKKLGYNDVAEYAKQCVISRVEYKRSRNPILRKAGVV